MGNLSIGGKLNLGFGTLIVLTLLILSIGYLASLRATQKIDRTNEVQAPAARVAAGAESNLLRMVAEVQEYLATGDDTVRTEFESDREAFEADLVELESLISDDIDPGGAPNSADEIRLSNLQTAYARWSVLPEQLFTLRDDPLLREPAFKMLMEEATPLIAAIIGDTNALISTQANREPTAATLELLGRMSAFQSSFISMVSGLRGYVTTGEPGFKFEYSSNLSANDSAWSELVRNLDSLEPSQQARLADLQTARDEFLKLPDQMFALVEGEHAREDLYLFRNEAIPASNVMLTLLGDLNDSQQRLLASDLREGSAGLADARWQTLATGLIALLSGLLLAMLVRDNIASPVRRLTAVAERIGSGELDARAIVESGDEIGVLARTFNRTTSQLQTTLHEMDLRQDELEDLNSAQQQQNAYLAALHETSIGLISRLNIDELLVAIISRAAELVGTTHGYIFLEDSAAGEAEGIHLRVGTGMFENLIGENLRKGEGLAGTVWATGEPQVVNDYDDYPGRSNVIPRGLIRETAGIPLTKYLEERKHFAANGWRPGGRPGDRQRSRFR